jgi:hypothetical protein
LVGTGDFVGTALFVGGGVGGLVGFALFVGGGVVGLGGLVGFALFVGGGVVGLGGLVGFFVFVVGLFEALPGSIAPSNNGWHVFSPLTLSDKSVTFSSIPVINSTKLWLGASPEN